MICQFRSKVLGWYYRKRAKFNLDILFQTRGVNIICFSGHIKQFVYHRSAIDSIIKNNIYSTSKLSTDYINTLY